MTNLKIEYPCLFVEADKKSAFYQKLFNRLYLFTLLLLVLSTLLSSVKFIEKEINLISGILLILSLTLTIILLIVKPEKGWYEGRAIAESIKSLSWKFITKAKPFNSTLSDEESEERLIKNFKKIIGQKKDFFLLIGGDFAKYDQITESMRQLRKTDLAENLGFYSKFRLEEQRDWYSNKSNENRTNKNKYFVYIIVFQLLAIAALLLNYYSDLPLILSPIFVCIASSLIAWLQIKRFQELTQSYSITATELSMIKTKIKHIKSQDDFSNFVDDAENAISREHTLWLARRDSIELFE